MSLIRGVARHSSRLGVYSCEPCSFQRVLQFSSGRLLCRPKAMTGVNLPGLGGARSFGAGECCVVGSDPDPNRIRIQFILY
ncbi:hypothetical protein KSP40_PGU015672 [Platanthera guangdongensis]|uniref:Uncharacterized protein n=1 Tax=Platanthera guangdongensis TaxID=2320717 RepID=A0ABR2MGY5_9ASPA